LDAVSAVCSTQGHLEIWAVHLLWWYANFTLGLEQKWQLHKCLDRCSENSRQPPEIQ